MPSINSVSKRPVGIGTSWTWCGSGCLFLCMCFEVADHWGGSPVHMGNQLAAVEPPGDQHQGDGREGDADHECLDQSGRVRIVLDQKEQPAEQADDRGDEHQDNRCLEHDESPGGRDAFQYSEGSVNSFRPGVAPSLVVLVLLPLLIFLGFWQLSRGEEKREMLANYAERRVATPLTSDQLQTSTDPAYRRVQLRGQFDAGHSLLLDNSIRDGRPGVELIQPFHDQTRSEERRVG